MLRAFLLASILATAWCAPALAHGAEYPQEVSLVALLANPRAYDGKLIRAEGYFDGTHFESCRLFLSEGDFEYHVARNSIYVRWPGCQNRQAAASVQQRYVGVEGVFQADIGAGFGSYSAIQQVRKLEPLMSRAEFQKSISAPWWLVDWPWRPLGIPIAVVVTMASYLIARRVRRR